MNQKTETWKKSLLLFISRFLQDTALILSYRGYGLQGVLHVDTLLQQ